jgi:hypothetical protein
MATVAGPVAEPAALPARRAAPPGRAEPGLPANFGDGGSPNQSLVKVTCLQRCEPTCDATRNCQTQRDVKGCCVSDRSTDTDRDPLNTSDIDVLQTYLVKPHGLMASG